MKAYIIIKGGNVDSICYTSLSQACLQLGVSYDSASRGKRKWIIKGCFVEIKEVRVIKIVGRGGKNKNPF